MTETTMVRLAVDHLRTRCTRCYPLTGPNKHSAVFVVRFANDTATTENLCWCCWFDEALLMHNDRFYLGSKSRARRRAACGNIRVYGTTGLGDEHADYLRSHKFVDDVMRYRLRKMFGG